MQKIKFPFLILIVCALNFHAQKSVLLHQSDYTHDYALSTLRMMEDLKDTARCKYIATVRVTGEHHNGLIAGALNLLKIKSKELGANSYYITSFSENEKEAEVTVRLFFAGNNVVKLNDSKRVKNQVIIFNQLRSGNDSAFVFINGKKMTFDKRSFYTLEADPGVKYKIQSFEKSLAKINVNFKKPKDSKYYVVPSGSKSGSGDIVAAQIAAVVASGIISGGTFIFIPAFKNSQPDPLSYDEGRFLSEIYKN